MPNLYITIRNIIASQIAVCVLTSLSSTSMAAEVAGDLLHVYGKLHVSIDNSDTDGLNDETYQDGISVSSNSSRVGLKGQYQQVIYQIEQEVRIDDSSKGNFADRNSFIGLTGDWGSLRAGIYDTPLKSIGSKWGLFGDTIGDRRAILGAGYLSGNQLNERVKNMIMYQYDHDRSLKVQAMYAVDPEDDGTNAGIVDNNKNEMVGAGIWWHVAEITLSLAYEDWTGHSYIIDGNAYRIAVVWTRSRHRFGAIYEDIDPSVVNEFSREAFGVNWKWRFIEAWDLRLQYLVADNATNTTDTGGSNISAGTYHELNDKTKLYLAYTASRNDANAKFPAVDGGHGDEVKTIFGGHPNSLSLGIEFKF
ncbi:MAG: porin [Gammaproteobacteria bacterium]|nr:porin [Gammaproteobacteria bacterium]